MDAQHFAMQLGARIAAARLALNLSQESFGEALSVTKQTVSAWEKGRNFPGTLQLRAICELTGREANYFIHGEDPLISAEAIRFALSFMDASDAEREVLARVFKAPASNQRVAQFLRPAPKVDVPQRRRAPKASGPSACARPGRPPRDER